MPKYLSNIDLNQNELQNAKLQNLATAPASPVLGQIYYNSTSSRVFWWNGTAWVGADAVGASMTGADIVAAINASESLIDDDNLSATANAAISASHAQNTDTGTTSATFQLESGSSGPKLKNSAGELQVRNAADNDYADLRVKSLYVEGTTTTINSNTVEIGDNQIVLNSDVAATGENSDGGIAVKRLMADNLTRKDAELNFNNTTGKWETISGAVAGTLVTAQIANKVTALIGDAAATSIAVTHNLNSQDCIVGIREAASPYAGVLCDWEFTDANTITFKFAVAPTLNQYSVTIIG